MCLAVPGQIVQIENRKAWVKYPGDEVRYAMIGELGINVGDYVIVQMGIVVKKLSERESRASSESWNFQS